MYNGRLKILIVLFIVSLSVGIVRLAYLQISQRGEALENIEKTGIKPDETLPTLRGSIIDRHGRPVAIDTPEFYIAVKYDLTRLKDERFWEANAAIRAATKDNVSIDQARKYWENYLSYQIELLDIIIAAAKEFSGVPAEDIEQAIAQVNDRMWKLRRHFAWKRNFPQSQSIEDFDSLDDGKKLMLEGYVNDLAEMELDWYMLVKIQPQRLYQAQSYFRDIEEVRIIPKAERKYPYGSTASAIIGWVNPQKRDNKIFADDPLLEYQEDELAGYQGVEYVCEPLLRGKRGKIIYETRSDEPIEHPREFGQDVKLTIDIELQQRLEEMFANPQVNANYGAKCAAVIIDVPTGEILASVSLPSFDLNTIRADFANLIKDPSRPLENKAMQAIYPPGSTIKPIILAAALSEKTITPQASISCTLPAEEGWPRCWLQRKYSCHDDQFASEGGNNAVNALRGSCNIYFTKLAHRMEARKLQQWLYNFGYGRKILQKPDFSLAQGQIDIEKLGTRNVQEHPGFISTQTTGGEIKSFDDISPMRDGEKRWFGMGQGNLRVTVLQVANAFSTIARDGAYVEPKLYLNCGLDTASGNLNLSRQTAATIKEGLHAVVNKYHGTAFEAFKDSEFKDMDITVYGKTGSTERPDNAWFAGFAKDTYGNCVAAALIIEEGQSGSHDASPLAVQMFDICVQAGYLKASPDYNGDSQEQD